MTVYLLFLFLFLFQTANGEITVTLQEADQSPISGEIIEFFAESEPLALGSCMTNESGTCTITVDAPVDASGFIRGTLTFSYGRRPVIWPGGNTLTLTLTIDSAGQFNTNSDAYVTRTPKATVTLTPKATVTLTPKATVTVETFDSEDSVGTQEPPDTEEPTKEPPVTEEPTKEPPSTEESTDTPIEAFIFRGILILILVCALIAYIWKTKQ